MWGGEITRQQILQSICLFQTLNEVPEPPKDHLLSTENDPKYCLSALREKEVTSNLAFLSSISDNPLRVMAVCIEEHEDKEGITIRMASNTGDMSLVVNGFNKMARVLEQAALQGIFPQYFPMECAMAQLNCCSVNSVLEDQQELLIQIIELDFYRILSRLRSRHARRSSKGFGKTPLLIHLCEAVHVLVTESGKEKIQTLFDLFNQLEGLKDLDGPTFEARKLVSAIVKEARELTLAVDLKAALEKSSLDPSLKEYIPEATRKVGRYYAAASDLISAARDKHCRLFLKVHVEIFQVQVPISIKKMKGELQLSSLPSSISQTSNYQPEKMENNLRKRIAEASMHLKVHAEIQLLFYYELNPKAPRPRFICSSKKACYLCDLFLHIHGRFHVPRTHGRLYEMWVLPDWLDIPQERRTELAVITKRFKDVLDERINNNLTSGLTRHPDPIESCVPSEAHYSSMEHSAILELGSQASRSTVRRPPSPPRQEVFPSTRTIELHSKQPSIPSIPPDVPIDTITTEIIPANLTAPGAVKLPNRITECVSSPDRVSLITVRRKNLPYSKLITLAAPSLHIRVGGLSITIDFAKALSGRLFIAEDGDSSEGLRVLDAKDLPTTSDLEIHCAQESKEVCFLMQHRGKGMLYIKFVWDVSQ